MAFIKVENFLQKFKDLARADISPRVGEIIKKKFPGAEFGIKVKNKEIYLYDISPALKSEIFFKQNEILEEAKEIFGEKAPIAINFRKF